MKIHIQEGSMAKKESKKPEKSKEKPAKEKPAKEKPEKSKDKPVKEKKGKNKKGDAAAANNAATGTQSAPASGAGATSTGQASVPLSTMAPDQMTAAQIEQALKESNDPSSQLKKLHSPLSVKSCLLNLLFLIILTLAIVIIWCAIAVDKFNFVTVVKDMSSQFGITQFFQKMWATIAGWFGG